MLKLNLLPALSVYPEQVSSYLIALREQVPDSFPIAAYPADLYADWLKQVQEIAKPDNSSTGVPTDTFLAVRSEDGQVVGSIELRHYLNDHLRILGGHVGYFVLPSERGKGYATQMLSRVLQEASALGLTEVLLTCGVDNIPSQKVIEKCGGVRESREPISYENEKYYKYWIDLLKSWRTYGN